MVSYGDMSQWQLYRIFLYLYLGSDVSREAFKHNPFLHIDIRIYSMITNEITLILKTVFYPIINPLYLCQILQISNDACQAKQSENLY